MKRKKQIKVALIAWNFGKYFLENALKMMEEVESYYVYDFITESYDFSASVNECDVLIILKGIGGSMQSINFDHLKKVKVLKILLCNDNICRNRDFFDNIKPLMNKIYTFNFDQEPGTKFIPFAADNLSFHYADMNKEYDATFIGNPHSPERVAWEKEVKEKCVISLFKFIRWEDHSYQKLIASSRISINQHFNDRGPNMRFFEAMISKSLMITDKVKGIPAEFKEGVHYATYSDIDDLANKIEYYIKHPDVMNKIVETAYNLVLKKHKYTDRLRQIFREAKLI